MPLPGFPSLPISNNVDNDVDNNENTDDEIEPLHGSLQIATNPSIFRQQNSMKVPIQFSAQGRNYDGWVLSRVLNSRYLYTITAPGGLPSAEKAFLLSAKLFSEKESLPLYKAVTLDQMKAVNRFWMMSVAMITLSNGQVLTIIEGLDVDTGIFLFVSLSVMIARWDRAIVKRKVADLRKRQQQRNLIKAT